MIFLNVDPLLTITQPQTEPNSSNIARSQNANNSSSSTTSLSTAMATPAITTFIASDDDEAESNEDVELDDDDDGVTNDPDFGPYHYKAMLQQMRIVDVADHLSLMTPITKEAKGDDEDGSEPEEAPISYTHLANDKCSKTLRTYNIEHKTYDEMKKEQKELQRQKNKKQSK